MKQKDGHCDSMKASAQRTNALKTISDGPSANLRPIFDRNVTKVSVIKLSRN